jgi:hypothetical protein
MRSSSALASLQQWMQGELAAVELSSDAAVARHVSPSPRLSSRERLAIYADMVRLRLAECLAHDFPGVEHALGHQRFHALADAYIERHPSTHSNLNVLGARFAAFVRDEARIAKHRAFLAELAELERAVQVTFDAPPSVALRTEELLRVPQTELASMRLTLAPGVQLLETNYPVNAYLQAVYDEREAQIPSRRRSWTLLFRRDYVVWRSNIDRVRFTLLRSIGEGATLGEALEQCAALPRVDAARLGASVSAWFEEWTADGVFTAMPKRARR